MPSAADCITTSIKYYSTAKRNRMEEYSALYYFQCIYFNKFYWQFNLTIPISVDTADSGTTGRTFASIVEQDENKYVGYFVVSFFWRTCFLMQKHNSQYLCRVKILMSFYQNTMVNQIRLNNLKYEAFKCH